MVSAVYLLDTNALSEAAKPQPSAAFMERLERHRHQVAISATTWHALLFGVERLPPGRRRDTLTAFATEVVAGAMPILAYDAVAAAWHARERTRLTAGGRAVAAADGQIAAVAVRHGLRLVTNNTRDFEGFRDLRLENWLSP